MYKSEIFHAFFIGEKLVPKRFYSALLSEVERHKILVPPFFFGVKSRVPSSRKRNITPMIIHVLKKHHFFWPFFATLYFRKPYSVCIGRKLFAFISCLAPSRHHETFRTLDEILGCYILEIGCWLLQKSSLAQEETLPLL